MPQTCSSLGAYMSKIMNRERKFSSTRKSGGIAKPGEMAEVLRIEDEKLVLSNGQTVAPAAIRNGIDVGNTIPLPVGKGDIVRFTVNLKTPDFKINNGSLAIATGVASEYILLDSTRRESKKIRLPEEFRGIKYGWVRLAEIKGADWFITVLWYEHNRLRNSFILIICSHAILIHILADFAGGFYDIGIGCIADINETTLDVFIVRGAPGGRLIAVLKVMHSDNDRVPKSRTNVTIISASTLFLIGGGLQAGVTRTVGYRAKVPFANDNRHVDTFRESKSSHFRRVTVEATRIHVFGCGSNDLFVPIVEAASKIKFTGSNAIDDFFADFEIGVDEIVVEIHQVGCRLFHILWDRSCRTEIFPALIPRSPGLVESRDVGIFFPEHLGHGLLCRLLRAGAESPLCQKSIRISPGEFIVHEVTNAKFIINGVFMGRK